MENKNKTEERHHLQTIDAKQSVKAIGKKSVDKNETVEVEYYWVDMPTDLLVAIIVRGVVAPAAHQHRPP